jgi:uncharacterized protein (TIGR02001 family)
MRFSKILLVSMACAAIAAAGAPASARDDADDIDVTATAGFVSDYRFRGVPLSAGKPALQGGVEIERRGWFAGTWGSTVADREHSHSGVELDLYAGHRGQVGAFSYSVTGYAYLAGLHQPAYFELQTMVGRNVGAVKVEFELSYAPPQRGASDNLYAGGRATLPIEGTSFSLLARGGYENGYYNRKFDWEAGASWSRGPLLLSATLIGARERGLLRNRGTATVFSAVYTW